MGRRRSVLRPLRLSDHFDPVEAKGSEATSGTSTCARVLRIFPLYYGVLAVAAVLGLIFYSRLPQEYRNVFNYQVASGPTSRTSSASIGWDSRTSGRWPSRNTFTWSAGAGLLSEPSGGDGASVVVIAIAIGLRTGRVVNHQDVESTYTWTFCRMDCLAIGACWRWQFTERTAAWNDSARSRPGPS